MIREPIAADAERLEASDLRILETSAWIRGRARPGAGWTQVLSAVLNDRDAGRAVTFLVERAEDPSPIGVVALRRTERDFRVATCQFTFSVARAGRDVRRAGLHHALDFAFRLIGTHRVELRALPDEDTGLLKALGFTLEGITRESKPVRGGRADETLWSVLRTEWQANRSRRSPWLGRRAPARHSAASDPDDERARDLPAWSQGLPTLASERAILSEIELDDADALLAALDARDVATHFEPPPTTPSLFRQYVAWVRRERQAARVACFAIRVRGEAAPVGLVQLRAIDTTTDTGEWGIVLAPAWQGHGLFQEVFALVTGFAFGTVGLHRIESRTRTSNAKAIASLRRLGAVREAVLRQSFFLDGELLDDELWTLLRPAGPLVARPWMLSST